MTTPPMFPVPEPHHFSDYGFDPQIDYFQVHEEARKHHHHHTKRAEMRPIDSVHFKLQKPISKEDARSKSKKRKWWWKSAIDFWKRSRPDAEECRRCYGPVYVTECFSRSGSRTPCRVASGPGSGPLTTAEVAGMDAVPYVRLRDLEVAGGRRMSASGPCPMPIYLVT